MAKSFSIEEIQRFHKLKTREKQLITWQESIAAEMGKLERQKRHQEDELANLRKEIKQKFAALDKETDLFNVEDQSVERIAPENVKKGMSSEAKARLLPTIIGAYLSTHPKEDTVPFGWIKEHLEEQYEIKCRSISNYFTGILDDYKLVGGNRNRAIKVVQK